MGKAQNAKYYNKQFEKHKKYSTPYKKVKYYKMWCKAYGWVKKYEDKFYPRSIIELGCGTGQFAHLLYDKKIRQYIGYDFSDVAIGKARKFSPMDFRTADIYGVNISVDNLIICLETLEHIDDTALLMRIPAGANMIISVPNFDNPAHVRYFKNMEAVKNRYKKMIDIKEIIKFNGMYYLFRGKRTEYIPSRSIK